VGTGWVPAFIIPRVRGVAKGRDLSVEGGSEMARKCRISSGSGFGILGLGCLRPAELRAAAAEAANWPLAVQTGVASRDEAQTAVVAAVRACRPGRKPAPSGA
jgi:hypothetical protein